MFATLVLLFVVTVQTIMLFDKVRLTYQDKRADLRFCASRPGRSPWVAWLGDVSAVLLIAIRTYRLVFYPLRLVEPVE